MNFSEHAGHNLGSIGIPLRGSEILRTAAGMELGVARPDPRMTELAEEPAVTIPATEALQASEDLRAQAWKEFEIAINASRVFKRGLQVPEIQMTRAARFWHAARSLAGRIFDADDDRTIMSNDLGMRPAIKQRVDLAWGIDQQSNQDANK